MDAWDAVTPSEVTRPFLVAGGDSDDLDIRKPAARANERDDRHVGSAEGADA